MQQTDTRLSTKRNDWNDKRIQTDHRCPFFSPIPDAYLCVRVDLAPDKKKMCEKLGLGRRAVGPSGRRDDAEIGPWAVGRGPAFNNTRT